MSSFLGFFIGDVDTLGSPKVLGVGFALSISSSPKRLEILDAVVVALLGGNLGVSFEGNVDLLEEEAEGKLKSKAPNVGVSTISPDSRVVMSMSLISLKFAGEFPLPANILPRILETSLFPVPVPFPPTGESEMSNIDRLFAAFPEADEVCCC